MRWLGAKAKKSAFVCFCFEVPTGARVTTMKKKRRYGGLLHTHGSSSSSGSTTAGCCMPFIIDNLVRFVPMVQKYLGLLLFPRCTVYDARARNSSLLVRWFVAGWRFFFTFHADIWIWIYIWIWMFRIHHSVRKHNNRFISILLIQQLLYLRTKLRRIRNHEIM